LYNEEGLEEILRIDDLVCGYSEELDIIRGVSLSIKNKSIAAILGPNGAGKSTLLKAIYGLIKPRKGKIIFNGTYDVTELDPWYKRAMGIVYIPQEQTYYPHLSVEENLLLCSHIIRVKSKSTVYEKINEVLNMFDNLKKKRKIKASYLSGGELKMLDIACGLVVDPKLMLIDEPSAGLAPSLMDQVYDVIKYLPKLGISILLVDQNIWKAVEISDYVYILESGKIVFKATSLEIKDHIYDIMKKVLLGFQ